MSLLAGLAALFAPSPVSAIAERTKPNPYAPNVGSSHWQIALRQALAPGSVAGIRGGLSGQSGSEAEYAAGQATPDLLVQDITAHALPPAMFHANVGREPSIYAFDRGPIGLGVTWGGQQRGFPHLVASTLLPPGQRTPTAREMAARYTAARPNRLRLDDIFAETDA